MVVFFLEKKPLDLISDNVNVFVVYCFGEFVIFELQFLSSCFQILDV